MNTPTKKSTDETPAKNDEFRLLLEEIQSGSRDAACKLIEHYTPHILRSVRRRLSKAIRAKFDSIDFVQAVWVSFFAAPQRLVKFDHPENLVRYLVTMAHNKVVDEFRRRVETDKYNVNREWSLDDSTLHLAGKLAARQPSPSAMAVADEFWAHLLEGRSERHRRILELRREGNTHQQIADQLGLNEKTVRRVIHNIFQEQAS